MARKSIIARENKRALLAKRYADKRVALKKIISNIDVSHEEKYTAINKLNSLPKNSSLVRRQRRCNITGRPHAVYRKFGLCRNKLREFAMEGCVPGLRKASW